MSGRTPSCWIVIAVCLATPVLGAEEGAAANPFAGDLGTALWTLIIFVLVVLVLGKFAWGPILRGLKGREDFIRDSLERAKRDREQAEATLKEYCDRLEAARAEASALVDEGRRDALAVRRRIEEEAKAEADAMLERAKREIGLATDSAVKKLYDLAGGLAMQMASRIIRKELNAGEHERLIAESIDELERTGGNGWSES